MASAALTTARTDVEAALALAEAELSERQGGDQAGLLLAEGVVAAVKRAQSLLRRLT